MELTNYNEVVNNNRETLINSFTSQYREENRSLIESKFNKLSFCFYANFSQVQECINSKKHNLGIKYTFELFQKMGIDIRKLKMDNIGNLTSDSPDVSKIIEAFFPSTGYLNEVDFKQGIFCFSEKYQENTDYNLMKKAIVLNKMGTLANVYDMKSFMASPKYSGVNNLLTSLAKMASDYRERLETEIKDLEKIAEELKIREKSIIDKYTRDYIFSCREFMNPMSKANLEQNPDIDFTSIPDIEFFLLDNHQSVTDRRELLPINAGLIEYFSKENTNILLKSQDTKLKAKIISKRLEYLAKMGITDLGVSNAELFDKDWYQVENLKGKLPNINIVERIRNRRLAIRQKCLNELASNSVINNYQITDLAVRDAIIAGKNVVHENVVVFNPLSKNYLYADIDFDELLREVLETTINKQVIPDSAYGLEAGSEIAQVKSGISFYIEAGKNRIGMTNFHINRIMTRKLAIEATKKRHAEGIFLFNRKDEVSYINTSRLDKYFPNFDAVFPRSLQDLITLSKILPTTALPLYSKISQEALTTIDNIITRIDDEVYSTLKSIGNNLSELSQNTQNNPPSMPNANFGSNKM